MPLPKPKMLLYGREEDIKHFWVGGGGGGSGRGGGEGRRVTFAGITSKREKVGPTF